MKTEVISVQWDTLVLLKPSWTQLVEWFGAESSASVETTVFYY